MRPDQFENSDTDLHVLAAWLRNRGLKVELHEHPLAKAVKKLDSEIMANLSPDQLHVTGPQGKISVIRGGASFGDYEIYSLEGDLFGGIRRYRKVEHAGKSIHSLLTTEMFDESVPRVFSPMEDFFGSGDGGDGSVQEVID